MKKSYKLKIVKRKKYKCSRCCELFDGWASFVGQKKFCSNCFYHAKREHKRDMEKR